MPTEVRITRANGTTGIALLSDKQMHTLDSALAQARDSASERHDHQREDEVVSVIHALYTARR